MKKIAFLTALMIGCAFQSWSQKNTPVQLHGQLKVSAGKILDKNNREPQLRGISMSWSIWGGKKYYNTNVVNWLKDDFRISLLRLSMAVEPDSGYLQDPVGQTRLITRTADEAIKLGIYVIIDWHDHHAHLHPEKAKAFFAEVSKKYAGIPNVIYEIYNEPERVAWPLIKNYAIEIIAEIRKHDPQNLIVVGSPSWDQDIDVAAKDPVTGYANIAYSFHFYASEPSHQERLMQKADAAIHAGLPIFVTEWGVGEADGNGKFDQEKTAKWFQWMETNKLSWANWNITDKDETTALLKPGAPVNGKWKADQLTPAGSYIRSKLRTLAEQVK
ncbi:glycoside hydrolase family 5 protein [Pedobacter metabolipauper]|uniref:Endoglucanase n=1 Tax=Pedobacter metabolipauper TaxID=425513 RepID=A0A4R6SQA0_9SPHI|nr:glycoside hydrolase family 5 protein [Pedobacter metabolipauper]TDQ06342.1 endoglucanase [Pedobacter metabolipauper]